MRFSTDELFAWMRAKCWEDGGPLCFAGGIQTQVNGVPAPGVAGDFADSNPGFRVVSGPGGLVSGGTAYGTQPSAFVAGASGTAVVGRFGWLSQQAIDPDNEGTIVNSFWSPGAGMQSAITGLNGLNAPNGFISRPDSPAVITAYLADATMVIQEGAPVPLWAGGRTFWVKNDGATMALNGQKAYADLATGKASFAASGAASTATFTGSIAAGSWSGTGSISGNVLTIGSITGTVAVGSAVSYSGSPSGLNIVTQLSGTAGGAGTYALNISELTVAAGTAITGTYGVLTVASGLTGTVEIGGLVTGSTTSAATYVTGFGTGSGGTGTYYLNNTQTVGSASLASTTNVETNWICVTQGGAGELVKITTVRQ